MHRVDGAAFQLVGWTTALHFPILTKWNVNKHFPLRHIYGGAICRLVTGVMSLRASFRHGQATSLLWAACSWSRQQSNWSPQCLLREATQTFPGCSQLLWLDPQGWSQEARHLLQQASAIAVSHLACPKRHMGRTSIVRS